MTRSLAIAALLWRETHVMLNSAMPINSTQSEPDKRAQRSNFARDASSCVDRFSIQRRPQMAAMPIALIATAMPVEIAITIRIAGSTRSLARPKSKTISALATLKTEHSALWEDAHGKP